MREQAQREGTGPHGETAGSVCEIPLALRMDPAPVQNPANALINRMYIQAGQRLLEVQMVDGPRRRRRKRRIGEENAAVFIWNPSNLARSTSGCSFSRRVAVL